MSQKQAKKVKKGGSMSRRLSAKISSPTGSKILFQHRYSALVAANMSIVPEQGYKVCFALVPELANRGMMALNAPGNIVDGKIEALLLNVGREIVEIKDGDPLVDVWIEATNEFVLEDIQKEAQ